MDAATVAGPAAAPAHGADWSPRAPLGARAVEWLRAHIVPHHVALALLLVVTFVLRLWGIKQGLPYSYNSDEATHFVPRAVGFYSHDLNPHYFLNPPAYSYLLMIVFELWFGSADAAIRAYTVDPTSVFVLARVVVAVLGTASVWLTYLAGVRLFNRTVALLAAAIFGLAFLPIFYSHLALNDVPTLAPVALSLYGVAGVLRYGRRRDYLIAGVGIGLAAATKYTGGITLACLLGATACDAAVGPIWQPARRLLGALLIALVAFLIGNPYALLDFSAFQAGVAQQASLAAGGSRSSSGRRPAAASPTTWRCSRGASAGAPRWPRSGVPSCCSPAAAGRSCSCSCPRRSCSSSSWATSSGSSVAG